MRGAMAVQCDRCGNFIQSGLITCPVCGAGVHPDREGNPSAESRGLLQAGWDNLRRNWRELFSLNRSEALFAKIIVALLIAMFAVTLYSAL